MKLKLHILDYASFAALLVYSASATITPVCLLTMSKELNFTLSAGGGIEASRSMLILLSLFFGGFAAAKIGKVRSLCAGLFGLAAGYAVYAYAPSYPAVLCASIIVGASCGIIEGLLNPLVQELHKDDAGRYLNISNAFWSVGVLSTVIVSGELLTLGISWRLIMAVLSCCSLAVGIFFATLKKTEQKPKGLKTSSVIRQYADCLSSKRFWVFCFMMVLAGGSEGAFTFWSASYIQVHFNALPRMGGAGTACFAAGMMCMRLASGFLAGQNKLRRLIFFFGSRRSTVSLCGSVCNKRLRIFSLAFFSRSKHRLFLAVHTSLRRYTHYTFGFYSSVYFNVVRRHSGLRLNIFYYGHNRR